MREEIEVGGKLGPWRIGAKGEGRKWRSWQSTGLEAGDIDAASLITRREKGTGKEGKYGKAKRIIKR